MTRKTKKERSLAGRRSARESGLGIGRDYDRRRGPVRGAPVDAHAHRFPHRHLAAGRRRPRDPRAGLRALPRRARARACTSSRWATASRPSGRARSRSCRGGCRSRSATAWWRSRGARAARRADVVYATATYAAAAAASTARAAPARREARLRPRLRAGAALPALLRARSRSSSTRRAAGARAQGACGRARSAARGTIVVPSAYLAEIAAGWGLRGGRIHVLTNPAPPPRDVEAEALAPGTFVFVGRLTRAEGARRRDRRRSRRVPDARLVVVGDGPERAELERAGGGARRRGRVEFLGALRATRRCASSPAPRPACSRATGRTCRTRPSRRSRSGCRSSRRRSAACPRSCTTARTGCSCRPATRTRSPPRSAACSRSRPARPARRRGEAVGRGDLERRDLRPARGAARGGGAMSEPPARPLRRPRALHACRCRPGWRRSGTRSSRSSTTASSARPTAAARPSDERFRLAARAAAPLDGLLFYLAAARPRPRASSGVPARRVVAADPFVGAAALAGRALAGRRRR